ncbi:MAG: hypothetical protein ACLPF1_07325 [Methanoregula sp.]|uniref:hypothetical protein n=1 Tax=Methanoregula sp. TaxID=2052170 RepID=UPI003BAEBDEE
MLKEPVFKPQTGQGESDLQGATGKQPATGKTDHFLSILMINNDRSAIVFRAHPFILTTDFVRSW